MLKTHDAKLILEDGSIFYGYSFGANQSVAGEVVFNTSMTGYPESLTDPSYCGQILTLTYPLVGNYGVPGKILENDMHKFFESEKVQINALIISDYSFKYNHWNADQSLDTWLKDNNIPGIYGIGDVIDKELRQIITAASDGSIAGVEVSKYVETVNKNLS